MDVTTAARRRARRRRPRKASESTGFADLAVLACRTPKSERFCLLAALRFVHHHASSLLVLSHRGVIRMKTRIAPVALLLLASAALDVRAQESGPKTPLLMQKP